MEPKQWVLLIVFGCVLALVIGAVWRGRLRLGAGAVAAGLAALGGLAATWPELTTRAARAIGIDRGADLVAYATTIVVFVGFLMMYVKLRRVRSDLTGVVRRRAIAEAEARAGVADHETPRSSSESGEA